MIYLTGSTNAHDEPTLIAAGIGLMVQPGNAYHRRVDRYPWWAADNGCFNPNTYIGDDRLLDYYDRLPRERCLFAVVPDVSRRPDGSLGGDPEATWARFETMGPLVRAMGFPAALAAQDGIENMANLRDQLEACDVLFLGGSTAWKLGPRPVALTRLARSLGKWVHMGRVNSEDRIRYRARDIGCNSVDGTFLKYRRRRLDGENDEAREERGAREIARWLATLEANPTMETFETPSLPVHREAVGATAHDH